MAAITVQIPHSLPCVPTHPHRPRSSKSRPASSSNSGAKKLRVNPPTQSTGLPSAAQVAALVAAAQRIVPAACAVARNRDFLAMRARLMTEIAERYAAPMLAISQIAERAIVTGSAAAAITASRSIAAQVERNASFVRNLPTMKVKHDY
ncbi:hypothetical protein [Rhodopseudomonas parapalustris]